MRPIPKMSLNEKDKDFDQFEVTMNNIPKRPDLLVSADVATGEVVCRKIDGNGFKLEKQKGQSAEDLLETSYGEVRISRRPVLVQPDQTPVPGSTVDETKPKADNPAAQPGAAGQVASEVTKQSVKDGASA
jgi:hypothetical protein